MNERVRVAEYWWSRAQGEMTSWVGFGHVLEDLRQERAPQAIIELALRAVEDERRHAIFCRDWAVRFGHAGGEVRPRSERRLSFSNASTAENRLLRIALCCFTETFRKPSALRPTRVEDRLTPAGVERLAARRRRPVVGHRSAEVRASAETSRSGA